MENIKICVYSIFYNEEKKIEEFYKRLVEKDDHPDLVLLYDTGSTDTSSSIIKRLDVYECKDDKNYADVPVYYEKVNYDRNDINFSQMRNDAYRIARDKIIKFDKSNEDLMNGEWIFVSLDIDEVPDDMFFTNIRRLWQPGYNSMKITGITSDEKSVTTQVVEHKVHSSGTIQRYWVWKRRVHENLCLIEDKSFDTFFNENILVNRNEVLIPKKEWKMIDASDVVRYFHKQDLTKERDYYGLLKKELSENPDATTLIYCAWEAALHDEIDFSDELNKRCKEVVLSDVSDEHYLDWEYYIQCCINLAMHNKENYKLYDATTETVDLLKVIKRSVDNLVEASVIMEDGRYFKLRRVYGELAYLYKEAAMVVTQRQEKDKKESVDTSYAVYDSMIEGFYKKSLDFFNKTLEVKIRPYCWIESDYFYNNDILYKEIIDINLSLLSLYKESTSDTNSHIGVISNAIAYASLLQSEELAEIKIELLDKLTDLLKFYNQLKTTPANEVKDMNPRNVGKEINDMKDIVTENKSINKEEKKNKVAVYAICKNEGQFVKKWMESMSEADFIVVVDTGSTDNTYKILKQYESDKVTIAQTVVNPWRFDVARNIALDLVPSDYNILVSTDLDEILEPGWSDILREKWIEGIHERAIYKYSWSHLDNGDSGRIFQYDKVHSRKWRWRYPVHELLYNIETNSNLYSEESMLYIFDEMHLHHYPDRTKSRSNYLPLLELRRDEDPNDYYGLVYLAHEYFYQGEYQKSINTLNDILDRFSDQYTTVEEASCYLFKGDSYFALREKEKAIYNYLKAIFIEPTYREPYLNIAKVYLDQQHYSLAEDYVKMGILKSYRHYTWLERDNSWSWEPYDLLSLACFYGGKKRDSLAYALKAYRFDPENERLQKNVNVILENMTDEELLQ